MGQRCRISAAIIAGQLGEGAAIFKRD